MNRTSFSVGKEPTIGVEGLALLLNMVELWKWLTLAYCRGYGHIKFYDTGPGRKIRWIFSSQTEMMIGISL